MQTTSTSLINVLGTASLAFKGIGRIDEITTTYFDGDLAIKTDRITLN